MAAREHSINTFLVAGGAGFLGAHLCRSLLQKGHRVICLDSFVTGSPQAVSDMLAHPGFELIEHDIIDPLPETLHPTHIFNLACPASPKRYQEDPIFTLRTCVLGSNNLLELAVTCNARILQASTSEVYGDPEQHPQHENYHGNVNPVGTRSCYDEGKRCAETLFVEFQRVRGARVKIARIFNTYGPGMAPDDGRVVSNFFSQALTGRALTVYGDGSQTRSLCYVDDMVEALQRLMASPEDFVGPVNLGGTEEITVLQIAHMVRELVGHDVPIVFRPLPSDDPCVRRPDTGLAQEKLGWKPEIPLRLGLAHTYEYFCRSLGNVEGNGASLRANDSLSVGGAAL